MLKSPTVVYNVVVIEPIDIMNINRTSVSCRVTPVWLSFAGRHRTSISSSIHGTTTPSPAVISHLQQQPSSSSSSSSSSFIIISWSSTPAHFCSHVTCTRPQRLSESLPTFCGRAACLLQMNRKTDPRIHSGTVKLSTHASRKLQTDLITINCCVHGCYFSGRHCWVGQ